MLTLLGFDALSENEKAEIVWQGNFLADREVDGFRVQLYSLTAFYVEVFYDTVENKIAEFRAFTNKQFLAPYLAQVKFI